MRSIRNEVTKLTIIVVIVSMALASLVAVFSLQSQGNLSSDQFVSMLCKTHSDRINARLSSAEHAVNMAARYVDRSISATELAQNGVIGATGSGISLPDHDFDGERQQQFDSYLKSHVEEVRSAFFASASQVEGTLGFYYRINPEISRDVRGFLSSNVEGGGFATREPTNITEYASNDYARVGWYYLPQERGRPTWIDPYDDGNQHLEVVSFVAPIYKAGTFVGVVGIDIPYEWLVDQIRDLEVPFSGYAFLTDAHGKILYHPSLHRQVSIGDINNELEATQEASDDSSLTTYTYDGEPKRAAWASLNNGMHLVVCAPLAAINAGWYELVAFMLVSAAAIAGVVAVVVTSQAKRITGPLEDLTFAATQLAEGNFDVSLAYEGDDEVGILTTAFRKLVTRLKVHISELNRRIYTDALTNLRNKGAYDMYIDELGKELAEGTQDEFAIVAFDCNDLKRINDSFGHDKGDIYLRTACRIICNVYSHSPVFRVGGDEFMAVLTRGDYLKRDELLDVFVSRVWEQTTSARNDWEKASIAVGMATYDPGQDLSVEDVAQRADKRMYDDKTATKATNRQKPR